MSVADEYKGSLEYIRANLSERDNPNASCRDDAGLIKHIDWILSEEGLQESMLFNSAFLPSRYPLMTWKEALKIVLDLAENDGLTPKERAACSMVSQYIEHAKDS